MADYNINAALRSSMHNECYLFVDERYVVVNYAPGFQKGQPGALKLPHTQGPGRGPTIWCIVRNLTLFLHKRLFPGLEPVTLQSHDNNFTSCAKVTPHAPGFQKYQIVNGPIHSSDVFPIVYNIECAFDAENNEAFIFFGEECAKIDYGLYSGKATLLTGPIMVGAMFPCLKGTVFESGFDTAIRSTGKDVILFHEDNLVTMDYHFKRLRGPVKKIRDCFRCLVGTVFEKGIDSGFASHITNEAYIFKGEYFARINIGSVAFGGTGDYFVNGRIELIRDEWPALHSILHYN